MSLERARMFSLKDKLAEQAEAEVKKLAESVEEKFEKEDDKELKRSKVIKKKSKKE